MRRTLGALVIVCVGIALYMLLGYVLGATQEEISGGILGLLSGSLFAWFILLPWLDRHWPIR